MDVRSLRKVKGSALLAGGVLALLLLGVIAIPLFGGGCSSENTALIAHAGENQSLLVGRPARLDGSLSRATSGGAIEYHWSIVERPPTSRAELVDETATRPGFTPDCPGTYVFELSVSAGSAVSPPAQIVASVDYAPADFVYVDTRVVSGDAASIGSYYISKGLSPSVSPGPTLYPAPPFTGYTGSPVGFQVMVINRADGTVVSHKSYPITTNTQANALATDLTNLTANHLVIVSSLQYPAVKKITDLCGSTDPTKCPLLGALEKVGASSQAGSVGSSAMQSAESYSLIGIGASGAGNGYERWSGNVPGSASIAGVLVRDNLQKFGFTYEYVPFETRTSADTSTAPPDSIVIGDTVYPLPTALPDTNSGGFHVLVLNRSTLQPISHTLYLLKRSGTADSTAVKTMANDLYAIAKSFDKLVIVAAVGSLPTMRSFKSNAAKLEWAIDLLGGTPGIIPNLKAGDTYGLVGVGPGPSYPKDHWRLPETNYPIVSVDASSLEVAGLEADIRGLLKKDHQGWFVPTVSNPGGSSVDIDYSLLTIALQEPTGWRGPDTDAERKVYADISRYLLGNLSLSHTDDMRLYYYRDLGWSSLYTVLHVLTCEELYDGEPCASDTQQAFATMRAYLDQEVLDRNQLQDWFDNDIVELLDGLQQTEVIDLATAYQNAISLAQVQSTYPVLMKVLDVLSDVAWLVCRLGEFAGPANVGEEPIPKELGPAAGVVTALIRLGMDFIPSPTNNAPGEVKEAASELWINVLQTYIDTRATTDQAFLYLTEDWGRMEAFHAVYTSLYDKTQYETVLEALAPGITASFYRVLLPVTFKLLPMPLMTSNFDPTFCNPDPNPCNYYACSNWGYINYYESNKCLFSQSQGVYRPADALETVENLTFSYTECTTSSPLYSYYTIWKGGGTKASDYYSDKDIKLFSAPSDGGLGVSRLDFFTRWPFAYASNGHWNDGCNCSPETHLCPDWS
jgi:hypothetical protein